MPVVPNAFFVHDVFTPRTIFGEGSLEHLREEAGRFGRRALVITTPGQHALGERALRLLGDHGAACHPHARMHVPRPVVDEALAAAQALRADVLVVRWAAAVLLAWLRR